MSAEILQIEDTDPATPEDMAGLKLFAYRIWDSVRLWFFGICDRCGIPGAIANAEIKDALTGQHITVRANGFFTVISVDGRDYYFRRISGRFDGTGCGCA